MTLRRDEPRSTERRSTEPLEDPVAALVRRRDPQVDQPARDDRDGKDAGQQRADGAGASTNEPEEQQHGDGHADHREEVLAAPRGQPGLDTRPGPTPPTPRARAGSRPSVAERARGRRPRAARGGRSPRTLRRRSLRRPPAIDAGAGGRGTDRRASASRVDRSGTAAAAAVGELGASEPRPAQRQDDDPVGQRSTSQVVTRQQDVTPAPRRATARLGVHPGRRLVEDQDLGPPDERQREPESLPLPAGQAAERGGRHGAQAQHVHSSSGSRGSAWNRGVLLDRLARSRPQVDAAGLEHQADPRSQRPGHRAPDPPRGPAPCRRRRVDSPR